MDGENNGKPYAQMDDLRGFPLFLETPIRRYGFDTVDGNQSEIRCGVHQLRLVVEIPLFTTVFTGCNRDHQDYMFRFGDSNLNLHFPHRDGGHIQGTELPPKRLAF